MYALNNPLRFIDPSGYKYGPSDYEREIARGEHTYYNWEMAWKLGGGGRLSPDPNVWNNIGRFHHSPGPVGTTTNSAGNTVSTFQDPITGEEYYWNSQEWEGDQSIRIVYETEDSYAELIRKDFGVTAILTFLNPFSNVQGPMFSGGFGDWLNKINNLGWRKWTDSETGTGYYIDDKGVVTGIYPRTGIAPAPGIKGGYSIYQGQKNGKVIYWGLTKSFTRRAAEHAGRFDDVVEIYSGLNRQAARGLEQLMIDKYGLNSLQNIRNGIGISNPRMMQYYQEAVRYLNGLGF